MSNKGKDKGYRFEKQCIDMLHDNDIDAKRAYGSNGLALGLTNDVDIKIEHKNKIYPLQCKVRKRLGNIFKPNENNYGQVVKQDYDVPYITMRFKDFIELLKNQK